MSARGDLFEGALPGQATAGGGGGVKVRARSVRRRSLAAMGNNSDAVDSAPASDGADRRTLVAVNSVGEELPGAPSRRLAREDSVADYGEAEMFNEDAIGDDQMYAHMPPDFSEFAGLGGEGVDRGFGFPDAQGLEGYNPAYYGGGPQELNQLMSFHALGPGCVCLSCFFYAHHSGLIQKLFCLHGALLMTSESHFGALLAGKRIQTCSQTTRKKPLTTVIDLKRSCRNQKTPLRRPQAMDSEGQLQG